MAFPHGPPIDRADWMTLSDAVKALVSNTFRRMPFAAPANQPINRNIPLAQAGQRWIPAPHNATYAPDHTEARYGLYEGAEGLVNLWCLVDGNNRIIDKILVKQVHPSARSYTDPRNWTNGVQGGEPREVAMANSVWAALPPGDRQHLVNCLGWGDCRGHNRWRYRLYFEYAGHGTLSTRIAAQRARKVGAKKEGQKLFPEPFLWMLLEALAKVALGMENAANGGVLHGDLHPGNILFGDHNQNRFAIYPTPKVADFGSSRNFNSPDVQNRTTFIRMDACNANYQPPELARATSFLAWEVPTNHLGMSNKINIWQIGMILACCMRLRPWLQEAHWRGVPLTDYLVPKALQLRFHGVQGVRELPRNKLYHGNSHYSDDLIDIVEDCMRFQPNDRPTAQQILNRINQHMPARLNGTDTYVPGPRIRANMKRYVLRKNRDDDKYRVGKVLRYV